MFPAEGGANRLETSEAASLDAASVPAKESIMAEYSACMDSRFRGNDSGKRE